MRIVVTILLTAGIVIGLGSAFRPHRRGHHFRECRHRPEGAKAPAQPVPSEPAK